MSRHIALFDICGTLFQSNTTFDFLDFYITDKSYWCFRRIMRCAVWRYTNSLLYRLIGIDMSRRIAISYLRGKNRQHLDDMADAFYNNYLMQHKNEQIWHLLTDCKKNQYEIALISGTIDPIARGVAQRIGAQYVVTSRLKYDAANNCCGCLTFDALSVKRCELSRMGIEPPYDLVVTDNPGDMVLVKHAVQATIVAHHNVRRWKFLTRKLVNVRILEA